MPRVQLTHIVAAQRRVEPLSVKKAEAFAGAVYASQPNLLASVLVLPRFGVATKDLDVVLKALFICHESVRETGLDIPKISEADQERCLARVSGRVKFLEGLDERSAAQAISDQVRDHAEPNLLAAVFGLLKGGDLLCVRTEAEKYLLLAVLNLVEAIAEALNAP